MIQLLLSLYYTLIRLDDTEKIVSWKSKGLSPEELTIPTTTNKGLSPSFEWYRNSCFCLVFKGNCLKQKQTPLIFLLIEQFFYFL